MRPFFLPTQRSTIHALLAASLLLASCARSPSVAYYQLSAMTANQPASQPPSFSEVVIGIGPVHIAEYLDRLQIVSRISQNRLQIAENSRWAEPLEGSIPQILRDNLGILLPDVELQLYPWNPSTSVDYQLLMDVDRFDATADGTTATLEVEWQLIKSKGGNLLLEKKHHIFTASAANRDQEAGVRALSMTLEQFSRELANEIKKVESLRPQSDRPRDAP